MKGNKNLISNKSKLNKAKTIQYQNKKNNQFLIWKLYGPIRLLGL